jgi:hypothetical protein
MFQLFLLQFMGEFALLKTEVMHFRGKEFVLPLALYFIDMGA